MFKLMAVNELTKNRFEATFNDFNELVIKEKELRQLHYSTSIVNETIVSTMSEKSKEEGATLMVYSQNLTGMTH